MWYVHKHEVQLAYGGAEEGGWWYTSGQPVRGWRVPMFRDHEDALTACRILNEGERERREKEEDYNFTSVLAYRSTHYEYSVEETPKMTAFPAVRPHYE